MLLLQHSTTTRFSHWITALLTILALSQSVLGQTGAPCPPGRCIPITVRRVVPGEPNLQPTPLPPPRFVPQSGSLPYGTNVGLVVDKTIAQRTVEYSDDNGKTWIAGASFLLLKRGAYLARTREGNRTSEVTTATLDIYFQRMIVLGNSIMSHGPAPNIGWLNFNGMAASALDKDFAHLLERNLKAQNPQFQMKLVSGGGFERNFWEFDYSTSLDEHLNGYAPDLIIVRIGENISEAEAIKPEREFKARYRQLLDKLTQFSGQAKVVCTTSFWDQAQASAMIREVAAERGYPVADIHAVLYNRPDRNNFRAYADYADAGVGSHPNDAGMAEIARLILEQVR